MLRRGLHIVIALAPIFYASSLFSDAEIKRRILVLPFDNVLKNKNYDWMSESIADNLKEKLIKSERFEVLDVTLLRKIDPNINFRNLTDQKATQLATRLNCEVAIIGRFIISKEEGKDQVLIQTEGVDSIAKESVVIKSQYATLDNTIFDAVKSLSEVVADEMVRKIPAITAKDASRDEKLEKLIRRLTFPPKGYLDTLTLNGMELRPEFDIDTFEYEAYFVEKKAATDKKFTMDAIFWGKSQTLVYETDGLICAQRVCNLKSEQAKLVVASKNSVEKYTIRIKSDVEALAQQSSVKDRQRHRLMERWWLALGYPYLRSLPIAGQTNPAVAVTDRLMPFDAYNGMGFFEFGLSPARWQPFESLRWSFATSFTVGRGDVTNAYNGVLSVNFLSLGGGPRIDYRFERLGIALFFGLYSQYQRFFYQFSTAFLQLMALNPEIGINKTFSLNATWRLLVTLASGGYFYQNQNLSYVRLGLGVEYAFR